MDMLDKQILDLLEQNARMSVKEIAAQVALTPPAVSQRIRRLEQEGIIQGYTTVLHLARACLLSTSTARPACAGSCWTPSGPPGRTTARPSWSGWGWAAALTRSPCARKDVYKRQGKDLPPGRLFHHRLFPFPRAAGPRRAACFPLIRGGTHNRLKLTFYDNFINFL